MTLYLTDKPGPPQDLAVTTISENSIGLKWKEPTDDGGSEITNYVIQKREVNLQTFKPAGTTEDQDFLVEELTEGAKYVLCVAAENECGVGEPAEIAKAVEAKSPHGAYISLL